MAAARHWAGDGAGAGEAAADLEKMGAPAEIAAERRLALDCPVYAENVPALEAFLAVATQWRLAPSGALVGLDYAAAKVALTALGIRLDRGLMEGLQVMERAAADAVSRRAGRFL